MTDSEDFDGAMNASASINDTVGANGEMSAGDKILVACMTTGE